MRADTAAVYRNEAELGEVLSEWLSSEEPARQRQDLFVTSKLAPKDQGYEETLAVCHRSLELLRLEYLDLFLVHWPGKHGLKPEDPLNRQHRAGTWRAMEELYASGKVRAIGVSNYTVRHLEEMLLPGPEAVKIPPMVNQVELHPWFNQRELIQYCQGKGIVLQAYSSLGQGEVCSDERLVSLAQRHNKTPAQILLRWGLQHGCPVIPKSARPERIRENFQVMDFELTNEDMAFLDSTPQNRKICWDPETVT